jgi:hypothetical protein
MSDLSAFPITTRWPARHPERLQLYSLPTPNGVKVSIALEEIGLPYEPHAIDIGRNENSTPEFLSLNPNGKIPAIIDPDGPGGAPLGLFESGAILLYLAEKTGMLVPADAARRYKTIQWVFFQMAFIGPMFGQVGYFHKFAGREIADKRPLERYRDESKRLLGGSILGPGIAAISLGVVGHDAFAQRLGRNQRFASMGSLTAAGMMAAIGYLLSTRAVFLVSAALAIPLFRALVRIHAADIHFGRSCCAPDGPAEHPPPRASRIVVLKDRRLLTFATCLFLFPTRQRVCSPDHGGKIGAHRRAFILALHIGIHRSFTDCCGATGAVGGPECCDLGTAANSSHRTWCRTGSLLAFRDHGGPDAPSPDSGAGRRLRSYARRADGSSHRGPHEGDRAVQSGPRPRRHSFRSWHFAQHFDLGTRCQPIR